MDGTELAGQLLELLEEHKVFYGKPRVVGEAGDEVEVLICNGPLVKEVIDYDDPGDLVGRHQRDCGEGIGPQGLQELLVHPWVGLGVGDVEGPPFPNREAQYLIGPVQGHVEAPGHPVEAALPAHQLAVCGRDPFKEASAFLGQAAPDLARLLSAIGPHPSRPHQGPGRLVHHENHRSVEPETIAQGHAG